MAYIKIAISGKDYSQDKSELLIAILSSYGIESFQENQNSLDAWVDEKEFDESLIKNYLNENKLDFSVEKIDDRDWNAEWEKNYSEIYVDDKVLIKSDFHKPDFVPEYVISINPEMTFGTGHHQTTRLMVRLLLKNLPDNLSVLDWGSGTGILAILSEQLNAKSIDAIDNDPIAVENLIKNISKNKSELIKAFQASIEDIYNKKYDLILANINKNQLIKSASQISQKLIKKGGLMISGFYVDDLKDIKEAYADYGLKFDYYLDENHWCAAYFIKL